MEGIFQAKNRQLKKLSVFYPQTAKMSLLHECWLLATERMYRLLHFGQSYNVIEIGVKNDPKTFYVIFFKFMGSFLDKNFFFHFYNQQGGSEVLTKNRHCASSALSPTSTNIHPWGHF